jgi:hypothetical protein
MLRWPRSSSSTIRGRQGHRSGCCTQRAAGNDEKPVRRPAALMSLTMLVEDEGRNYYTAAEYTGWLEDVGFREVQRHSVDVPGSNGILIARKP